MKKSRYKFSSATVDYYFQGKLASLDELAEKKNTFILTDKIIYAKYKNRIKGWKTIVIDPGEDQKSQNTVDWIISELIRFEADRNSLLIGMGGGVITDLAGYVGSIYMRGISFGFIPTTLVAMVDASIGGKNGIDVDRYKNLVGVIRQPSFILFDVELLNSLPNAEWINGFSEIIKHASIGDLSMFRELEKRNPDEFRNDPVLLSSLIMRNADFKSIIVKSDEFEKNKRRILNFGHTIGHALEKTYNISHGQAVSIGMSYASIISEKHTGFNEASRICRILLQYDLPAFIPFDVDEIFEVLKMDKKKERKEINYVMLEKIGRAIIKPLSLNEMRKMLKVINKSFD